MRVWRPASGWCVSICTDINCYLAEQLIFSTKFQFDGRASPYEMLILQIFKKYFTHTQKNQKIANLISKLNFYKLIPYPMDNCFTGRRDRSRQTPEKDVLYIIPAGPVSSVHSLGGASYLLPV